MIFIPEWIIPVLEISPWDKKKENKIWKDFISGWNFTMTMFLLNFWTMYSICCPTLTCLNIMKVNESYCKVSWDVLMWEIRFLFYIWLHSVYVYVIFIKYVTCVVGTRWLRNFCFTLFRRTMIKNVLLRKFPIILITMHMKSICNIIKCSHFMYLDLLIKLMFQWLRRNHKFCYMFSYSIRGFLSNGIHV